MKKKEEITLHLDKETYDQFKEICDTLGKTPEHILKAAVEVLVGEGPDVIKKLARWL